MHDLSAVYVIGRGYGRSTSSGSAPASVDDGCVMRYVARRGHVGGQDDVKIHGRSWPGDSAPGWARGDP